jgi:hypothetical protein
MNITPESTKKTEGFYFVHIPGIGWVCSHWDVHFRTMIKYHVSGRVGSYETWLKRLAPGLKYHFVWNVDYQCLAFIGATHKRSGVTTLAAEKQAIWR